MSNETATKIYEALKYAGAELGNASVFIIQKVLDEQPSPRLREVIKEVACDFYFENVMIDVSDGYQNLRDCFDDWYSNNEYHKVKLKSLTDLPLPASSLKWKEVIERRIEYFASKRHKFESRQLGEALNVINNLIPPDQFNESAPTTEPLPPDEPDAGYSGQDQREEVITLFGIVNICTDERLTSSEKVDEMKSKYIITKK